MKTYYIFGCLIIALALFLFLNFNREDLLDVTSYTNNQKDKDKDKDKDKNKDKLKPNDSLIENGRILYLD